MKTCRACGEEFSRIPGKNHRKYCSDGCRPWKKESTHKHRPKIALQCRKCGKEFISRDPKRKYCSTICCNQRADRKKKLEKERHCANCGRAFNTIRDGQRFCSVLCGQRGAGIEREKRNYDNNHPIIDGILMKRCYKCKELKPMMFEYYYRSGGAKDGFAPGCRECAAIKHAEYRKTQGYKEYKKRSYVDTLESRKAYNERTKPERRVFERERRRRDVHFNIKNRMRSLIFISLRRGKEGKKWSSLLGYTVDELRHHLEKQFTKGMTWQRFLDGEIHIDHKIPVSAFNFTTENDIDFKRCWAITNLQPLWAKDNLSKNDKILYPFQPSLGLAVSM